MLNRAAINANQIDGTYRRYLDASVALTINANVRAKTFTRLQSTAALSISGICLGKSMALRFAKSTIGLNIDALVNVRRFARGQALAQWTLDATPWVNRLARGQSQGGWRINGTPGSHRLARGQAQAALTLDATQTQLRVAKRARTAILWRMQAHSAITVFWPSSEGVIVPPDYIPALLPLEHATTAVARESTGVFVPPENSRARLRA